ALSGAIPSIHTPQVNKNQPSEKRERSRAEETRRHGRLQASWVPDRVALRRPRLGPVARRRCRVVTRDNPRLPVPLLHLLLWSGQSGGGAHQDAGQRYQMVRPTNPLL
ncbi:hypothetical protein GW17_00008492, partial [Ensete ventricosum]